MRSAGATIRAPWRRRVPGFLIDFAPGILALIALTVAYALFMVALLRAPIGTESGLPNLSSVLVWAAIGLVLALATLGWSIYNRWLLAGRDGRSVGKRVMRLHLVSEQTGEPIGPGNAFARDLIHCLDVIALVGFLWPLWDSKRQTFADMVMNTAVIDERNDA